MDERTYRRVLRQFLNDYWGAFHEVLEAQSVNPHMLTGTLFDALVNEHRRFAVAHGGESQPAVENLGRLWHHVSDRRTVTTDAPLTAKEISHARTQFEAIYDALMADGGAFPNVGMELLSHAVHGTPRTPLRPDAAR